MPSYADYYNGTSGNQRPSSLLSPEAKLLERWRRLRMGSMLSTPTPFGETAQPTAPLGQRTSGNPAAYVGSGMAGLAMAGRPGTASGQRTGTGLPSTGVPWGAFQAGYQQPMQQPHVPMVNKGGYPPMLRAPAKVPMNPGREIDGVYANLKRRRRPLMIPLA